MAGLKGWDPLSRELLVDVLVVQYGWVLALALCIGVARTRGKAHWHHLPVLCWALVTARSHLSDFVAGCGMGLGPMPQAYWIAGYESLLGLCGVCVVQVLGLSFAGRPAMSLGATGIRRLAMTMALLSVMMDMFVFLWVVSP